MRRSCIRYLIYPALAGTLAATDLACKDHIVKHYEVGEAHQKAGSPIIVRSSRNKGAAMNAGDRYPAIVKWLSVGMTVLATILFAITLSFRGRVMLKTGLALLLGGAFSNTYDRLRRGSVVDYISFDIGFRPLATIAFNIGDFGIIIGALLAAISASH